MNNKTRLKTHGILTAVLLVVVGAVWFYPHNHSGKVPHAKKDSATGEAKHVPHKSAPASTGTKVPKSQATFVVASGKGADAGGTPTILASNLKLNDAEVAQVMALLETTCDRVNELMADNSTIIEAGDNIIRLKTNLPDEQSERLEKEVYQKLHQILGDDRWELYEKLTADAYRNVDPLIRGQVQNFGRGSREYTITGMEKNELNDPGNARVCPPFATASGLRIFLDNNGAFTTSLIYSYLPYDGYRDFKIRFGKMATLILTAIEEQNKRTQ